MEIGLGAFKEVIWTEEQQAFKADYWQFFPPSLSWITQFSIVSYYFFIHFISKGCEIEEMYLNL